MCTVTANSLKAVAELFLLKKLPTTNVDSFLGPSTAENAFKTEYVSSGAEISFWDHLAKQKESFSPSENFPFFAIVQSSGYGKSRLVTELQNQANNNKQSLQYVVVYLSFATQEAYPRSNVRISPGLYSLKSKSKVQAFVNLFEEALTNPQQGNFDLVDEQTNALKMSDVNGDTKSSSDHVLFIIDEVSQLLKLDAQQDSASLFRCFRAASDQFQTLHPSSFFVILATYTSMSHTIPGVRRDPSRKMYSGTENLKEPLKPFLMHETLGLRNKEREILASTIAECHKPWNLLSMGRPLWKALIDQVGGKDDQAWTSLIGFALEKLLLESSTVKPKHFKVEQTLALLGCRACLTISPVSWYAPALVGGHMATAVRISDDREEVTVSYPSEPILAIASRSYMTGAKDFLEVGLMQ